MTNPPSEVKYCECEKPNPRNHEGSLNNWCADCGLLLPHPKESPVSQSVEWEKDFDERWNWSMFTWNGDNITGKRAAVKTRRSIKKFVSDLLTRNTSTTLTTLVKEMEGLKKVLNPNKLISDDVFTHTIGFNAGIDKAIEVIQSRYLR